MAVPDPVGVLRGHNADVQAVCYDDSEENIVSGDAHGEVRVWSLGDMRPKTVRRLHPVSAGIINLALFRCSRQQQVLVTQGRNGTTHLWSSGPEVADIAEHPMRSFERAAYSFCRFSLLAAPAAVGQSSNVQPVPAPGKEDLAAQEFLDSVLAGGGPSQPQQEPATAEDASEQRGDPIRSALQALHQCSPDAAAAGAPPALLAIPGNAETEAEVGCCWCGATVALVSPESAGLKFGICMALCLFLGPSGGLLLAAGYESGDVAVWDLGATAQKLVAQGKLHAEPVMALCISPGGGQGVSGSAEDKLVMFGVNYEEGRVRQRHAVDIRKEGVGDVAVRPDGKVVASAGWDGRVRLYKCSSGKRLAVLKYHSSAATVVAFSPRTHALATAARDGTIALWDVYSKAQDEL